MINSALGYSSYNNYVDKMKNSGQPPYRTRAAMTAAMALLILLFVCDILLLAYAIYIAWKCATSDFMRVAWILCIFLVPFVSLGTVIYGVTSGCAPIGGGGYYPSRQMRGGYGAEGSMYHGFGRGRRCY